MFSCFLLSVAKHTVASVVSENKIRVIIHPMVKLIITTNNTLAKVLCPYQSEKKASLFSSPQPKAELSYCHIALSIRIRLFTFSASSQKPLDGFWSNLVMMKHLQVFWNGWIPGWKVGCRGALALTNFYRLEGFSEKIHTYIAVINKRLESFYYLCLVIKTIYNRILTNMLQSLFYNFA